ncbi:MAG: hypothetical protein Q7T11_01640 [Deltaproteobacteria bacterium]|nr:hypothetical protein [Deltaproteobacteria bacterium]
MIPAPRKLVLLSFGLILLFGGPPAIAKDEGCSPRLQAIEWACKCPESNTTRHTRGTWTVIEGVMVTDCMDPDHRKKRVACSRDAPALGEVTERTTDQSQRTNPPEECLAAVNAAKAAGCVGDEREAEWECGRSITTLRSEIPCETLEALPTDCPTPVPGTKETEEYLSLVGDLLAPLADPEETGFENHGSSDEGAPNRPSFQATAGLPRATLDQSLPENRMRLEIPANFLRYIMSSTVLPWACRELNDSFFAGDATGRSKCDPATLQFQIDPIALAPLENFNRNESPSPECDRDGLTDEEERALHCDRGELKMRAERTSDGGIRLRLVKLEDRGFNVSWHDGIYFKTEKPLKADLKNDFHFQFTAPHQPSGKSAAFDHFGLLVMVPYSTCQAIADWKIKKKRPNGTYIPWAQNYIAHCDNSDPAMGDRANYVVFDPVGRQHMNPHLQQYRTFSQSEFRVGCTSELRMNGMPEASPNARGENLFDLMYNRMEIQSEGFHEDFFKTLNNHGCMGLKATYVRTSRGRVPSVIPFTLKGRITPPTLSAAIHNDILNVEAAFLITISEKLKKRVWTWVLGWFMRIIERILSGLLTVLGTYLVNIAGLVANKIVVEMGPLDLQIDGVVTHGMETSVVSNQSVGIRRVIANVPEIRKTDVTVDFSFDACSPKGAWRGPRSLLRFVVGCPLQAAGNIRRFLLGRLAGWILQIHRLLEWIIQPYLDDLILKEGTREMTRLTRDSKFAALIDQAQKRALYNSHDLLPEPISQQAQGFHYSFAPERDDPEAKAGALPPPLVQACGLAEMALPGYAEPFRAACLLMQALTGVKTKHFDASFEVKRIGATSHYRSLTGRGREWMQSFSSDWPATYYCGHAPLEFSPDGRYLPPSIGLLTDFNEIDHRGNSPPGPVLNYTRQCALFFDLDFVGGIILQGDRENPAISEALEEVHYTSSADPFFSFKVELTRRSEFLLNEIFVCESSRSCNPGENFILDRAKLAMCSIVNDMRFEISDGQRRLLSLSLVDALRENPTLIENGLILLDQSDPVTGRRVRQLTDDEKVAKVIEWIEGCPQMLEGN